MNLAVAQRKRDDAARKYGPRSRVTHEREADLREIVHANLRAEVQARTQREKEIAAIIGLINSLFEIAKAKLIEYERYPLAREATRQEFSEAVKKATGWIQELERMRYNG